MKDEILNLADDLFLDDESVNEANSRDEYDAKEFYGDYKLGIQLHKQFKGRFNKSKFQKTLNDLIEKSKRPEATIKIIGRELNIEPRKLNSYTSGEIIEDQEFIKDSTKKAEQLYKIFISTNESVNEAMKPSQVRSAISKVKKGLMRKYLVISIEDGNDFYLVDDLTELISEMYECELFDNEFEVVKGWFFDNYKVFVSGSDIIELTKDID